MVKFQVFSVLMKTRDMFHNNIHTAFSHQAPEHLHLVWYCHMILNQSFFDEVRQNSVFFGFCSCDEAGQTPPSHPKHHFPQAPQTFSLISFPQMEDRATKTSNEKAGIS